MSSIKVVDVDNNEEAKQEEPTEQIEEVKEEINEVVEEPVIEQESKTEEVEEVCKEVKTVKAQDKLVRCPKCNREMKMKSFRYGHEQKCQGTLEQKPVKPFSKPRATPKPKTQPIIKVIKEVEEEEQPKPKPKLTQEVSNQVLKPTNQLADITNHYQLLQNQFIQQKKEKYNSLCQNMFSSKTKMKR